MNAEYLLDNNLKSIEFFLFFLQDEKINEKFLIF